MTLSARCDAVWVTDARQCAHFSELCRLEKLDHAGLFWFAIRIVVPEDVGASGEDTHALLGCDKLAAQRARTRERTMIW